MGECHSNGKIPLEIEVLGCDFWRYVYLPTGTYWIAVGIAYELFGGRNVKKRVECHCNENKVSLQWK